MELSAINQKLMTMDMADQGAVYLLYTEAMLFTYRLQQAMFESKPYRGLNAQFRSQDTKMGFEFKDYFDWIDHAIDSVLEDVERILNQDEITINRIRIGLDQHSKELFSCVKIKFEEMRAKYSDPDFDEAEFQQYQNHLGLEDVLKSFQSMQIKESNRYDDVLAFLESEKTYSQASTKSASPLNDTDENDSNDEVHNSEENEDSNKEHSVAQTQEKPHVEERPVKTVVAVPDNVGRKRLKNASVFDKDNWDSIQESDAAHDPELTKKDSAEVIAGRRSARRRRPVLRGDSGTATPQETNSGAATPKAAQESKASGELADAIMPSLSEADLWHAISKLTAHVERLVA